MKRIFALLICVLIVFSLFASCASDKSDETESEIGESIKEVSMASEGEYVDMGAYELKFESSDNGSGASLAGVFVHDEEKATVLEIPETTPSGKQVVEMKSYCFVNIPQYIIAEDFENQILAKNDSSNKFQQMLLESFYMKLDINDIKYEGSPQVKQDLLERYPCFNSVSVIYVLVGNALMNRMRLIALDKAFTALGLDIDDRQALVDHFIEVTGCYVDPISRSDTFKEIKLPSGMKEIDAGVFDFCNNLENVTVAENNSNYKSIDGNLYSKDGKTLIKYLANKSATSFTVPAGVVEISESAVAECNNLTEVIISDEVMTIKQEAFKNCKSLKNVTIGKGVTFIGMFAFNGCSLENVKFAEPTKWYNNESSSENSDNITEEASFADVAKAAEIINGSSNEWIRK